MSKVINNLFFLDLFFVYFGTTSLLLNKICIFLCIIFVLKFKDVFIKVIYCGKFSQNWSNLKIYHVNTRRNPFFVNPKIFFFPILLNFKRKNHESQYILSSSNKTKKLKVLLIYLLTSKSPFPLPTNIIKGKSCLNNTIVPKL